MLQSIQRMHSFGTSRGRRLENSQLFRNSRYARTPEKLPLKWCVSLCVFSTFSLSPQMKRCIFLGLFVHLFVTGLLQRLWLNFA